MASKEIEIKVPDELRSIFEKGVVKSAVYKKGMLQCVVDSKDGVNFYTPTILETVILTSPKSVRQLKLISKYTEGIKKGKINPFYADLKTPDGFMSFGEWDESYNVINIYEYSAICITMVKRLVDYGWSMDEAWKAVCDDCYESEEKIRKTYEICNDEMMQFFENIMIRGVFVGLNSDLFYIAGGDIKILAKSNYRPPGHLVPYCDKDLKKRCASIVRL